MERFAVGSAWLELDQGDVTQADTVAIGNAANSLLMGGGGVDGAIHRAAGPELLQALRAIKLTLPGGVLPTGRAVITPGFKLKAKHVIHCVGPIYDRDGADAPKLLAGAYREALELCREHQIESIAFPSISTGVYGYPVAAAARVALAAVQEGLLMGIPTLCRFVLFDATTFEAYRQAALGIFH